MTDSLTENQLQVPSLSLEDPASDSSHSEATVFTEELTMAPYTLDPGEDFAAQLAAEAYRATVAAHLSTSLLQGRNHIDKARTYLALIIAKDPTQSAGVRTERDKVNDSETYIVAVEKEIGTLSTKKLQERHLALPSQLDQLSELATRLGLWHSETTRWPAFAHLLDACKNELLDLTEARRRGLVALKAYEMTEESFGRLEQEIKSREEDVRNSDNSPEDVQELTEAMRMDYKALVGLHSGVEELLWVHKWESGPGASQRSPSSRWDRSLTWCAMPDPPLIPSMGGDFEELD